MRRIFRKNLIAWIMLLAIGLHGLVPVGYMPDFSGHNWLVACDGTEHSDHCHHNAPCPYSVGALFGFGGVHAPAIEPPAYDAVLSLALPADERFGSRSFGNASSRSPPAFS